VTVVDGGDLERLVIAAGETWAREAAARLREDGRPVAGGWPGTLSEARQRVAEIVSGASTGPHVPAVFDNLVRLTYASARRIWLAQAHVDSDE